MIGKIIVFKPWGICENVYFKITDIRGPFSLYICECIKSSDNRYKVGKEYMLYQSWVKEISEHDFNKIRVFE